MSNSPDPSQQGDFDPNDATASPLDAVPSKVDISDVKRQRDPDQNKSNQDISASDLLPKKAIKPVPLRTIPKKETVEEASPEIEHEEEPADIQEDLNPEPIEPEEDKIQGDEPDNENISEENFPASEEAYSSNIKENIHSLTQSEQPEEHNFSIEDYSAKRPEFRKIDPKMLDFIWEFLSKDVMHQVSLGHVSFSCVFNKDIIFEQFRPFADKIQIAVYFNNEEYVVLELSKALLSLCLYPTIEPISINELGDDILMNVLEITLAKYIDSFEKTLGLHISLKKYDQEIDANYKKVQWIAFDMKTAMEYPVNIYGTSEHVRDMMNKLFAKSRPNKSLQLTVPLVIISAVKQFALSKINSLKAGEIIIVMTDRHLVNEPLAVIGERLVVQTKATNQKLEVTSPLKNYAEISELHMNQGDAPPTGNIPQSPQAPAQAAPAGDNVAASMADMRVPVSFELGKIDLPVNFLSKVSVGQVIDLQKPLNENVSIVVNNKVIALGEVVQVGRNFGVIIKEVL
ncbi:MAG: FliM/FliN family flagellar motor switch protein [Pseudomonadota bacterium]